VQTVPIKKSRKKNHYNKYFHSEKTSKHFDQCGSHSDKNIFFFLVALASLLTQ